MMMRDALERARWQLGKAAAQLSAVSGVPIRLLYDEAAVTSGREIERMTPRRLRDLRRRVVAEITKEGEA